MRKIWCILLSAAMLLCGCGGRGDQTQSVTSATEQMQTEMTESLETAASTRSPELTEEELAEFQTLFENPMDWHARALTSRYADPRDADLEKLFYCGAGETPVSDEEREYLMTQWIPELFDFDIVRCDEAVMEEALQTVFGIGLDQMTGVGLDRMTYYNGAYFAARSDVLITIVQPERGVWLTDGEAELYYESDDPSVGTCCVTMRWHDGRWVIWSNMQVD